MAGIAKCDAHAFNGVIESCVICDQEAVEWKVDISSLALNSCCNQLCLEGFSIELLQRNMWCACFHM